jgi:hypothetical protein
MSRNFLPKAEALGEDRISLRPFDQVQKAEIREASTIVRRNRVRYFPVTARHEFVRNCDRNGISLGDRQKVWLTFGSNSGNQRLGIKPLGMLKDRARYINRIIKGKYHDDVERGIVEVSHSLSELGSGCQLNFVC